jgi:hypothetical protein
MKHSHFVCGSFEQGFAQRELGEAATSASIVDLLKSLEIKISLDRARKNVVKGIYTPFFFFLD